MDGAVMADLMRDTMRSLAVNAAIAGALSAANGLAAMAGRGGTARQRRRGNARQRRRFGRIMRRSSALHFAAARAFARVVESVASV